MESNQEKTEVRIKTGQEQITAEIETMLRARK
jgi:hypothetical protein